MFHEEAHYSTSARKNIPRGESEIHQEKRRHTQRREKYTKRGKIIRGPRGYHEARASPTRLSGRQQATDARPIDPKQVQGMGHGTTPRLRCNTKRHRGTKTGRLVPRQQKPVRDSSNPEKKKVRWSLPVGIYLRAQSPLQRRGLRAPEARLRARRLRRGTRDLPPAVTTTLITTRNRQAGKQADSSAYS